MKQEILKKRFINLVGNSNGSYKDKYNRSQKLINNWDILKVKLERMVVNGGCNTVSSRYAWLMLLILETGIRIGNEDSADGYVSINKYSEYFGKEVQTYGATTLQVKHITINKGVMFLKFLGKKQVPINTSTNNPILVQYGKHLIKNKLPEEKVVDATYSESGLYNFIKRYIGSRYSAKDLRTAKVNLIFIDNIQYEKFNQLKRKKEINNVVRETFEKTAKFAGHTVNVCRSKYVSPDLVFAYKESLLFE